FMSFAPMDLPDMWRRSPPAHTGNAFAVAPGRTQNGNTLLGINPHTDYEGPFQWYESHLILDDLNIYGATLFGVPVILQGHNETLGWALTPNKPDFADVYLERRPQMDTPANQLNVQRTDAAEWLRRITL